MNNKINNKKIAIIGAGISGITLARELSSSNEVTIFEKSRGIGGRMATRRAGNYNFDHGTPFFRAKTKEFRNICQIAQNNGVIEDWKCQLVEIVNGEISQQEPIKNHPILVSKPQMNSFCKFLGKNLNILLKKQIESLHFENDKWSLKTSENEIFDQFDYLFLAIPSHQVINLIPNNFKYFDIISNIKMTACFSLMLGLPDNLELGFDAALVKDPIISLITINNLKPERPKNFSLIVNSTNIWAENNIDQNINSIKEKMIDQLKKIISIDLSNIEYENIHRWKFANADYRKGEKSLFDPNLSLGVCGDWLIVGSVENAFLSGLDLYKNINK